MQVRTCDDMDVFVFRIALDLNIEQSIKFYPKYVQWRLGSQT